MGSKTRAILTRVPEITLIFWVIKVLTTGMGEVFSDYLMKKLSPEIAVTLGGIGLLVSLVLQFSVRRYVRWIYWLVVIMVSIFGTMAADIVNFEFKVPIITTTTVLFVTLMLIFAIWYAKEKTLSIDSIYTFRREAFYWSVVLITFSLGTAAGDMTAGKFHLGFFTSGVLFTILLVLPALLCYLFKLNKILAFWFSYIMTRPVGASFSDWACVPSAHGGLGMDKGLVSLGLTLIIVVLVSYLSITGKDVKEESGESRSIMQDAKSPV